MASKYQLKVAILELTRRCNLSCLHCGSACDSRSAPDELDYDEWRKVIDSLAQMKTDKIVFSGGEATISPHFEKLIRYAYHRGVRFGIISNGFNLSDDLIDLLKDYPPFAVGISIDGRAVSHNKLRSHPYAFIKAIDSLRRLKEAQITTAAVTTLNTTNYCELLELAPLLDGLGVDAWQIQLAMPIGRMKDNQDWLVNREGDQEQFREICKLICDIREKYPFLRLTAADCFGMDSLGLTKNKGWQGCSAGIYGVGIKSNGDVLPCLSLYDDRFNCGNIRNRSIVDIWNDSELFSFNRNFNVSQVDDSSSCSKCRNLEFCRGGCASMSYAFNGRLHDSPFCVDRINQV